MSKASESETSSGDCGWEREALTRLANAALQEQRRARRWGILFKFLTFLYLSLFLVALVDIQYEKTGLGGKHTALVDLKGIILAGENAGADNVIKGLRAAFKDDDTAGVILRINSPGGSPVQSSYINAEITRLREKHPDTPLYAVIADIGASGAYYAAVAADKIYADKGSIVGSIGVRMDGFGLVEAIDKLGVERRLLVSGEHKALLDPFLPVNPLEKDYVQDLLDELHQQFIAAVKKARGDRLADDDNLFSGLIWSGEESVKLGLVDALGSAGYVAREVIGAKKVVDYTKKRDWYERLADRLGGAAAQALASHMLQPSLR
jgi:protease-4